MTDPTRKESVELKLIIQTPRSNRNYVSLVGDRKRNTEAELRNIIDRFIDVDETVPFYFEKDNIKITRIANGFTLSHTVIQPTTKRNAQETFYCLFSSESAPASTEWIPDELLAHCVDTAVEFLNQYFDDFFITTDGTTILFNERLAELEEILKSTFTGFQLKFSEDPVSPEDVSKEMITNSPSLPVRDNTIFNPINDILNKRESSTVLFLTYEEEGDGNNTPLYDVAGRSEPAGLDELNSSQKTSDLSAEDYPESGNDNFSLPLEGSTSSGYPGECVRSQGQFFWPVLFVVLVLTGATAFWGVHSVRSTNSDSSVGELLSSQSKPEKRNPVEPVVSSPAPVSERRSVEETVRSNQTESTFRKPETITSVTLPSPPLETRSRPVSEESIDEPSQEPVSSPGNSSPAPTEEEEEKKAVDSILTGIDPVLFHKSLIYLAKILELNSRFGCCPEISRLELKRIETSGESDLRFTEEDVEYAKQTLEILIIMQKTRLPWDKMYWLTEGKESFKLTAREKNGLKKLQKEIIKLKDEKRNQEREFWMYSAEWLETVEKMVH